LVDLASVRRAWHRLSGDLARSLSDARLAAMADDDTVCAAAFVQAYLAGWQRLSDELAAVARNPRFREAVTWQSPQVIDVCVDRVAEAPRFGGRMPLSRAGSSNATATDMVRVNSNVRPCRARRPVSITAANANRSATSVHDAWVPTCSPASRLSTPGWS
jgi:hypothetical protein